ncbi:hypothetical protein C482_03576 [Natrialba chahannaoensis JCM 10990]|uniref:Uncharacterized protein n=1 Tax=Natrialba chahannaoensis JCM 10990 TaxID=1227492 RepID=M0AZL3_9EURY|nr:hypothetical protein [Natrialba chahannaoensis]ELZ04081.1 hypothetical protein C482_03576 [Natrialba chahannaoensis JCM 10990]
MTRDGDYTTNETGGLSQFKKNRFFKGKLMTPRDMEAEQEYHAERLETITRFLDGSGIVHGLEVQSVSETETGLDVTLDAGFALDGRGRPIVVEQVTTKSLPEPTADEVHLFIQYSEVAVETVPVPDTDGAIDDEAVPNRDVEVFELTHREEPPETPTEPPTLDLSEFDPETADAQAVTRALTAQYHAEHRTGTPDTDDPAVYLGGFERQPDGRWDPIATAATEIGKQYAADHDLLFAALAAHLADTDNPHQTPVSDQTEERPDDLTGIVKRLRAMEETVGELEAERDTMQTYLLRKTVKDRVRFFETLSDRLEPHTGEGARITREIAELSRDNHAATTREDVYRAQLSALLDYLVRLGEPLESVVTEESLERYLKAVSRLQSQIDENGPLLELIDAHDQVCEAAESLEILVGVVPEA